MPNTLHSEVTKAASRSVVAPTLFAALPDHVRQRLIDGSRTQSFSEGQLVTLRHEQAEGFWLIEAGSVRVGQFSEDGEFDVIAQLGPGDSYGELAVLSGRRRVVDAVTQEGAILRWISAAHYEHELAASADTSRALMSALARQLQEQLDAMVERIRLPAAARLAIILLRMGSDDQSSITINQQELAELVGVTRMTISTALAKLQADGLIQRGYGQISILDPAGLVSFAHR
ncbi:Crp/Fnr family transcriptional regulator [Altererythrobacter sp. ZODW24]|uniref:Crp/Fnr family transcriptional regulator n=1 Tax=Altererythrobacter sp. ZODW24 TaxID=2185142 RepID=UPI000DF83DE1|nr:Crp/Fnr family transcriptional regulator [Altererythrobacter sp. ZODW24]